MIEWVNCQNMEIIQFSGRGFKIKGKSAVVTTDFTDKKTQVGEFVIDGPGEYEVAGVTVYGTPSFHKIYIDEVNICALFNGESKLVQEELDSVGNVDILLVLKKIDEIVTQIEPFVILTTEKVNAVIPQQKFVISKDKLPETTTVVCLQ